MGTLSTRFPSNKRVFRVVLEFVKVSERRKKAREEIALWAEK
jgi:hypothetical protein